MQAASRLFFQIRKFEFLPIFLTWGRGNFQLSSTLSKSTDRGFTTIFRVLGIVAQKFLAFSEFGLLPLLNEVSSGAIQRFRICGNFCGVSFCFPRFWPVCMAPDIPLYIAFFTSRHFHFTQFWRCDGSNLQSCAASGGVEILNFSQIFHNISRFRHGRMKIL